jgi:hypothetical protein
MTNNLPMYLMQVVAISIMIAAALLCRDSCGAG